MTKITGGVVSIEDGTKAKEEYSPARKVRVELHFDVPEDQDGKAYLDAVAAQAQAKVMELLGGKVVPAVSQAAPAQPAGEKTLSDKDAKAKALGLPTTDLTAKPGDAKPEAPKAAPRGAAAAAAKKKADAEAAKAAAPKDEDDLTGEIAPEAPAATASDDDELFTVQPEEITDADLNHIVQVKNGELDGKGGAAIKKVISSYNPDPTKAFTLKQIPQASRAEFKERIGALTAKDIK
jgi:hypothetical protein